MGFIGLKTGFATRLSQIATFNSIREVAVGLKLPAPFAIRNMIELLSPIKLTYQLNAGTSSGSCEIEISSNGFVRYTGKVHNSGGLASKYVVITSFPASSDTALLPKGVLSLMATVGPVIIAHEGHVGGTFSFDSRDSTWDQQTLDARIAENWVAVKYAVKSAQTVFSINTGLFEVVDGLVMGGTGWFVFTL